MSFWGHVLVLIRTRGEAFWFLMNEMQ